MKLLLEPKRKTMKMQRAKRIWKWIWKSIRTARKSSVEERLVSPAVHPVKGFDDS